MRKVNPSAAYDKIFTIRRYIFEEIMTQIINGVQTNLDANKYLKRIKAFRSNKSIFLNLISNITKEDAEKCLNGSTLQDTEIRNSIFAVSKIEVSSKIIDFLEFIYEKILFSESYWHSLDEGSFSKMIYKEEFFKDQGHCICPYCDSKEDFELLDFEIDHLLPKSEFPLLYIHEMNLFPCCSGCNHNYYGKGNNWNEKYYNLFENTLGLKIEFQFDPEFRIIGIDPISTDFFKLIQLEKRSKRSFSAKKIDLLKKKIFRDYKRNSLNKTFLDEHSPDYFLINAIYNYYNSIPVS